MVVTTLVVITRVVKGSQNIILSSMGLGMLHVKTWEFGVRNVKFGVKYGLGVVMPTLVFITRVVKGSQNIISSSMGMLHVKT